MTRLLLAGLLVALVGCGAPTSAPTADGPLIGPPPPAAAPAAVEIPAIGARSTLIGLGLNRDGTMAVPPVDQPAQAAWYDLGVTPGNTGPALITGHVSGREDGQSVPGIFARLDELVPGDEVFTDTTDGRTRWVVDRTEVYDKDAFDWAEVAGDTDGPELRLITCGGDLETLPDGGRSYDSNTVVFLSPA